MNMIAWNVTGPVLCTCGRVCLLLWASVWNTELGIHKANNPAFHLHLSHNYRFYLEHVPDL